MQLLDTLPAHEVTGKIFWSAFRARDEDDASRKPDERAVIAEISDWVLLGGDIRENERALREGSRDWVALTVFPYSMESIEGSLPAGAIVNSDLLAPFGADAMPRGNLLAAGRGHCGGLVAERDPDGKSLHASLWVPHRMAACAVLSGPLVLMRRKAVEAARWVSTDFAREIDFARAVARVSFELGRDGARLGIVAALAVPVRGRATPSEQLQGERMLGLETGTEAVAQTQVAASPLRAVIPVSSWPAFVRRAEQFGDSRRG